MTEGRLFVPQLISEHKACLLFNLYTGRINIKVLTTSPGFSVGRVINLQRSTSPPSTQTSPCIFLLNSSFMWYKFKTPKLFSFITKYLRFKETANQDTDCSAILFILTDHCSFSRVYHLKPDKNIKSMSLHEKEGNLF